MKRWLSALLALALLTVSSGLAECEGWAVAMKDTWLRKTPDPEGEALMEIIEGTELEYGGFIKYDEDREPWYGVTWEEVAGWIPGGDVELKWSTLY